MRRKNWLAGVLAAAMMAATLVPFAALAEEASETTQAGTAYAATGETASEAVEPSVETVAAAGQEATAETADPSVEVGSSWETVQLLAQEAAEPVRQAEQPWDGVTVDTAWYEPSQQVYTLTAAAELAGLAKLVNEGNSFAGKTILLGADVDLNGQEWTPIGGADTGKIFAGIFDGQNHTISHLKITRALENTGRNNRIGLFGAANVAARIRNFTIDHAQVSGCLQVAAVLGGSGGAEAQLSNVHVTGRVSIRGWWYVGGILGKGYSTVTDCSVEGDGAATSAVAITGGYVGGIVGFMGEDKNVTSGCKVSNITVSGAYNGIGGINGILHYGNIIRDCTVENVVVWQTEVQDEETGRIYVGAFAGTYLDNNGKTPPTLSGCDFTGEIYSGPDKKDVLEATRYVGSLWYGAEPPATVQIENCTIHIPEKTPEPTPDTGERPEETPDTGEQPETTPDTENPTPVPTAKPSGGAAATPAPTATATPRPQPTASPSPTPVAVSVTQANKSLSTARPVSSSAATSAVQQAQDNSVKVQAEIREEKATASVDRTTLAAAVDRAITGAGTADGAVTVTVEIEAPETARSMEVTLPVQELSALAASEKAAFVVRSPAAEVNFDRAALSAILNQASEEIRLVVTPVEKESMTQEQAEKAGEQPVFELTLESGGMVISDFGEGRAVVTLPYTLKEGQRAEDIVVWYLAEDGQVTECDTTCDADAGLVTFVTPHFSRYVIACEESNTPSVSTPEQGIVTEDTEREEPASGTTAWPVILVVLVVAAVLLWAGKRFLKR
ncbi:hypothetical protein [Subdoligranulum variabile]|nr:hypothetical protein [Subdoligranulum variabile]UWP68851.1 hypothetical protein NQ490_03080 [Subdoligranulum variabile]